MTGMTRPPGVCAYCGSRSTEQCASWCMEADYRIQPAAAQASRCAEPIVAKGRPDAPPVPPDLYAAMRAPGCTAPAADSRTLADVAGELKRRQATALDEGCAALLRAGVDVRDLEIVHETYSRSEEPLVIHSRAYVRVRREPKT